MLSWLYRWGLAFAWMHWAETTFETAMERCLVNRVHRLEYVRQIRWRQDKKTILWKEDRSKEKELLQQRYFYSKCKKNNYGCGRILWIRVNVFWCKSLLWGFRTRFAYSHEPISMYSDYLFLTWLMIGSHISWTRINPLILKKLVPPPKIK